MLLLKILTFFTGTCFLIYGISCLTTQHMREEFIRFGLGKWRIRVGYLQLLGAMGLLIGLFMPIFACVAALGLSVLMLLGFITRLVIGDGLLPSSPAFLFMCLNAYLFYAHLRITEL